MYADIRKFGGSLGERGVPLSHQRAKYTEGEKGEKKEQRQEKNPKYAANLKERKAARPWLAGAAAV